MGLYDRPYYQDGGDPECIRSRGGRRSIVTNLILINAAIYVVDTIMLGQSCGAISTFLAVRPESLLQPWNWWQFLTYGFAHDPSDTMHIFGNMLGLFFFGRDVETVYGRGKFLWFYLTAIVLGSVVWAVTEHVAGDGRASLIGASGAVTAAVILFAFHFPRRIVLFMMFLPMPAWIFGVLLVLYNMFANRFGGSDRVAYDVHLIGAAYAFVFYKTNLSFGSLFLNEKNFSLSRLKPKPRLRIHRASTSGDPNYDADRVLAKLHTEGESSLSAKERKVLEAYSRRMQQKHR